MADVSKIDELGAIDQASLEPQSEPAYNANFKGFEPNNPDQGGVAPQSEDAPAPQEQQEIPQETEASKEPEAPVADKVPADEPPVEEAPAMEKIVDTDLSVPEPEVQTQEQVQETGSQPDPAQNEYPDFINKILKFHEETGGGIDEYQRITQDFTKLDEGTLLMRYLAAKNPNFTAEELQWEFEENYITGEDVDKESREYKKTILKRKRDHSEGLAYFEDLKGKYAAELKSANLNKNIPPEVKQVYDNHVSQQAKMKETRDHFISGTDKVFSDDFSGFVFDAGESKYRIRESNVSELKNSQLDSSSIVQQFMGKDGQLEDFQGYHKALYAAKNADKIAKHFYEQGRADAITERAKQTKNIDMDPKVSNPASSSGVKVKFLGSEQFGLQ